MHDLACRCEMITRCCVPEADSSPPAAERGDGFRGDNELGPRISLYSPWYEARSEARRWLSGLLGRSSGPVVIRNNFIQHFGESKHQQLSRLTGVTVNEFIEKGRAHLNVSGQSVEDVAVAVLEVEAMLCDVQREFVTEEKSFMRDVTTERLFSNRKLVDKASPEFKKRSASYRDHNLRLVKVEFASMQHCSRRIVFWINCHLSECLYFQILVVHYL